MMHQDRRSPMKGIGSGARVVGCLFLFMTVSLEVGAPWRAVNSTRPPKPALAPLQTQPLTIGQPLANQQLSAAGEFKLYQVAVQAGQKIFVLLDKNNSFYTSLLIKEGGLPGPASSISDNDQAVELIAQATGYCYIKVESSLSSGGIFTITAHTGQTFPSLSIGQQSSSQELKWRGDAKWYQVPVQAGQKVFVLLDKSSRFYTSLSIKEGGLPGPASFIMDNDQAAELRAQATGYCYVRVESSSSSGGTFTITIHNEQTFPTLMLGQSRPNQELKWGGDARWYRVSVQAGQKIFVLLDKNSGGFYTSLSIKEGGLPDVGDNQSSDQSVELVAQATGYCYMRVDSNSSSGGTFTITAHSEQTFPSLSLGQASPNQELKWDGDMKWYQVPVQARQKIFVLVDKNSSFYTSLSIKEGGLPGSASFIENTDQAVELSAQATGYCYVRVESHLFSGGTFTITVHDERTFPSLSLGQTSPNQELKRDGSIKWYQVPVQARQKVFVLVDKNSSFYTSLSIKEGGLPGRASSIRDNDQAVELSAQATGYCYVRVESSSSSGGTFTITVHDEQTFPTLMLGQQRPNQELKWGGDARWYRVSVQAGQKIFVLLDKNSGGFYTSLSIKEGGLPDVGDNQSSDQSVELVAQATGYCYVRVDSNSSSGGVFTITAHSNQTFPTLMTGQVLANQMLAWAGDKRWYQFKQNSLGPLVVRLVKSGSWYATLRVRKDSLPTELRPDWSDFSSGDLEIVLLTAEAGTYYIEVECSVNSPVTYSISADADLSQARKLLTVDNEFVRAQISPSRGCVTSIVFKKGSNTELISSQWDSYLIDLGADPRLGQHLKSGWRAESAEVQSNYLRLLFKHPSGFANELVLSWAANRLEVRCDVTAPESVETFSVLRPGGGWESGRDKWAFPAADGVKSGSFTYPSSLTALYPPDNSWGTPSEGWIALWDDQVDEVYGFTFSGGFKAKISNNAGARQSFLFPVGTSRIAFQVVKPKPATPYEAPRALASGPFLTLANQVDKLFAGVGTELNYSLSYRNTGKSGATGTVIEDVLPSTLELVPGSISNSGTYDTATKRITWNIGSLAAGGGAQALTFKAKVTQGTAEGAKIVNTARVWSTEVPIATTASALTTVAAAPTIASISPNRGGNTGTVTVSINGTSLDPNAQVKLIKTGAGDIVATVVTSSSDGTRLTATFDLAGKTAGVYDSVVTNPGGGFAAFQNAFAIESGGKAQLWVDIIGRDTIRVGREHTFTILYGNRGNINALGVPLWIAGIPKNATVTLGFRLTPPPLLEGEVAESIDWRNTPLHIKTDTEIVLPLLIAVIPPGFTGSLEVKLMVPTTESFQLKAWVTTPYFQSPFDPEIKGCLEALYKIGIAEVIDKVIGDTCAGEMAKAFGALVESVIRQALSPTPPSPSQYPILIADDKVIAELGRVDWPGPNILSLPQAWFKAVFRCAEAAVLPELQVAKIARRMANIAYILIQRGGQAADYLELVTKCKKLYDKIFESDQAVRVITSIDPNAKVSSRGAGESRYLSRAGPFQYSILFENLETATAATQEVLITDQLDSNLDWSTFSLSTMKIGEKEITLPEGAQNFKATVDLRPTTLVIIEVDCKFNSSTGHAEWLFRGKDPYTGELADLLPPNKPGVAPRGEGWVSYSVKPKQNLTTGTVIKNKATIDFEVGIPPAPLDTPEVFNTIDADAPTSQVLPLAAMQNSAGFEVRWAGADVGAGIRDYTIFVSENGGPFAAWLSNTTATAGTLTGKPGGRYAFYSVARDLTGNQEATPATADATTRVATADLAITLTAAPNPVVAGTMLNYTIRASNNGPDAAAAVTVTDNLPAATTFFSCSAPAGGVCEGTGNDRKVTFASLAAGATATINLFARVNPAVTGGTTISNTAMVGASIDPNTANNSAMVTATTAVTSPLANVSAASYSRAELAGEAIVAAFGANLATAAQAATSLPLPTVLAGTTVKVVDSAATERLAPLFFVSPGQINYQIPPGVAQGPASVIVTSGDGRLAAGTIQIVTVAPGLFAANADGQGVAAAVALRFKPDNSSSVVDVFQFNAAQGRFLPLPIDLGPEDDQVFLVLFGTGLRNRTSLSAMSVKVGGVEAQVFYAGPQGGFVGLDQINVLLPRSLVGRGEVDVVLSADSRAANVVKVNIK